MKFQCTYVYRPDGYATVDLVNTLAKIKAAAVGLEETAIAHGATVAIIMVPGPMPSGYRHFRIMNREEDLRDAGLEEIPKWATHARVKIFVARLSGTTRHLKNFEDEIRRMHYLCMKKIKREDHAERRDKNKARRNEGARKRVAAEQAKARRQEVLDTQEYWGSQCLTPVIEPGSSYTRGQVMMEPATRQGWYDERLAD